VPRHATIRVSRVKACTLSALRAHECVDTVCSISMARWARATGDSCITSAQARRNSLRECPTATTSPYGQITSGTAVLTTGLSPAMYSSLSLGLMNRVDAPTT
jgi:hypothetical protein